MPVIVTVGLSRKLSKDYQSQGYSLNVQAELPATAIEDPNAMAQATDHMFRLANDLLDAQITAATSEGQSAITVPPRRPTGNNPPPAPANRPSAPRARSFYNGNGHGANGNGQGNGGNGSPHRGITDAQKKAIGRMAEKVGQDPEQTAKDEFGTGLSSLTIRQASEMIENLKGQIEAGAVAK